MKLENCVKINPELKSHPTGVRGLKSGTDHLSCPDLGRTPLGCVD